jgi:hypothetical protein
MRTAESPAAPPSWPAGAGPPPPHGVPAMAGWVAHVNTFGRWYDARHSPFDLQPARCRGLQPYRLNRTGRHAARRHPGATVVARDLAASPPCFVDAAFTRAIRDPAAIDAPAFTASHALIAELEVSDALVIGTSMNNFTVPAPLKAWID